ncbi:MAG: SANT/Myb domain-containing protein, partial [Bacteroidetes bacterium]|nr:SANT/Myb domain-containing protein [Bacteroidota bacterium]
MGDIPWKALCRRATRLGLRRSKEIAGYSRAATRGPRKDSCSEAEATLLKEIFENNSKKFIIEEFKKAGFDRSAQSIFRFARQLGLKRNPELIKQDMIEGGKTAPCPPNKIPWTAEEDEILKSFYPTSFQNEIESKLPGRTFKAIRERALKLGLSREKEFIDEDREIKSKKTLMDKYGVNCTLKIPEVEAK